MPKRKDRIQTNLFFPCAVKPEEIPRVFSLHEEQIKETTFVLWQEQDTAKPALTAKIKFKEFTLEGTETNIGSLGLKCF